MIISDHPLHRSGRAALPHRAPTLGGDAQAHEGIGMTDVGGREPGTDEGPHSTPRQVVALTATAQHPPPYATDRKPEGNDRGAIHRHAVVRHMTEKDGPQVAADRCLYVPLSTLRLRPCGRRRMTRGQCGWLDLH